MASKWVYQVEDIIYVIIAFIFLSLQVYYIVVISKQFIRKLREFKKCSRLTSLDINGIVKSHLLYNHKTILVKYVFIIGILSFEIILWSYVFIYHISFSTIVKFENVEKKVHMISSICSVHPRLWLYYHHPVSRFLPIIMVIMLCTLISLLSLLTTFLKKRYYVHPIRTSIIRYAVWWSFQVIILLACCTIYTFPILFILGSSLPLVNWFYLIYESKQLAYILRARIRDILYYEWDKVHYKQSKQAYRLYVVFTFLYITAMFTLILSMLGDFAKPFIRLVFLDQCYFETVYQFNFPLQVSNNTRKEVSKWTINFETYILPTVRYFSFILILSPFFLHGIWRCLTQCIRNRVTPIRYTPVYEGRNGKMILKVHRRKFCCS